MTFFTKNECINHYKQTDKTKKILLELYDDILEAHEYISSLKHAKGTHFYNISIKHIQTAGEITKPKNFNSNSFPLEIRNHIDEMSLSELSYTFSLLDKEIKLIFYHKKSSHNSRRPNSFVQVGRINNSIHPKNVLWA